MGDVRETVLLISPPNALQTLPGAYVQWDPRARCACAKPQARSLSKLEVTPPSRARPNKGPPEDLITSRIAAIDGSSQLSDSQFILISINKSKNLQGPRFMIRDFLFVLVCRNLSKLSNLPYWQTITATCILLRGYLMPQQPLYTHPASIKT